MKEARYWQSLEDGQVQCELCPQHCKIKSGKTGTCGVRANHDGMLEAMSWGQVSALHSDPIEKKPLYHFCPGEDILSAGAYGCNFSCAFCQNWQLVEGMGGTQSVTPHQLLDAVRQSGTIGLAYTYNEPLIWFEYLMDTAPLLKKNGYKVVLVTNGYIEPEPLEELLPYVDALNIDLKSIHGSFYKRLCKATLEPVKHTIKRAAQSAHVEITNLLVTGENTNEDDIRELVDFVASVDPSIPLHFSRYFPNRSMSNSPTPQSIMETAFKIGMKKLHYVYLGNIAVRDGSNTYCPDCGALLVERTGYTTRIKKLSGGKCTNCGRESGIVRAAETI